MKQKQIIGLDLVRFGAAASVMLYHVLAWSWAAPPQQTMARIVEGAVAYPSALKWTWFGWAGVQIFFVLSGFVIAYSANGASLYKFARNRIVRLVPSAWVCATLTLLAALAIGLAPLGQLLVPYVKSLTLFPTGPWIDGVYWTLPIEMAFYGLVAAMLGFDRFRRVEVMAAGLAFYSSCAWIATLVAPHIIGFVESRPAQLLLITHGCLFSVGVTAWLITQKGVTIPRLLVIAVGIAGAIIQVTHQARISISHLPPVGPVYYPAVFLLVGLGMIWASIAFNDTIHRFLSQGACRFIRSLGLATYPLYLLHSLIGAVIMRILADISLSAGAVAILTISLCISASFVVALILEPPLQELARRILDRSIGKIPSPPMFRATAALT